MTGFDERWAQMRARDPSDGVFVYGVKTTGVFCRPSCSSRRPLPENTVFFDTAAAAKRAGFRACLRCRPEAEDEMARLARFIEAHAGETLTLQRLAAAAGLSPSHVQRRFKAALGVSPKVFQAAARVKKFKGLLRDGDAVAGAGFEAGYGSTSRFYEPGTLGMTPSAYRAGGAGETIHYAARETALGLLMMAATERGVCFVQFGTSEAALRGQLAAEFPKAVLMQGGGAALDDWMAALAAHLAGGVKPDLPLDLRGTAFQLRVWRFLLSVKEGEVVSYTELAAGIGATRAVRAAASACAANRIAILIPCHRALRADGGLGGYRWGLERKRALLAVERAIRAATPAPVSNEACPAFSPPAR